jgi:hypothetical protein
MPIPIRFSRTHNAGMALEMTTETAMLDRPRTDRRFQTALDRVLDLLWRYRLSPDELRILLAVHEHEVPVSELAERFGRRAVEIRRSAAPLYARGLLRWRDTGEPDAALFGLTPAGTLTVRPFLSDARV